MKIRLDANVGMMNKMSEKKVLSEVQSFFIFFEEETHPDTRLEYTEEELRSMDKAYGKGLNNFKLPEDLK